MDLKEIALRLQEFKSVCVTGSPAMLRSRMDFLDILSAYSLTASVSVSKKTGLLIVCSDPRQTKIEKANALNIPVISEQQWFELVPELEAIGMWNGKSISYSLALEDNTTIYKDPESKIEIPNIKVVSVVDEIRGLKQLLDEGILTEEEVAAKKKQLLGI